MQKSSFWVSRERSKKKNTVKPVKEKGRKKHYAVRRRNYSLTHDSSEKQTRTFSSWVQSGH
jgi:hypothetical protein